jgi:hypothetical protein
MFGGTFMTFFYEPMPSHADYTTEEILYGGCCNC